MLLTVLVVLCFAYAAWSGNARFGWLGFALLYAKPVVAWLSAHVW